jgi:hypothetical protein
MEMPAKKVNQFGSDTAFERAAQPAEIAPLYVFRLLRMPRM